MGSSDFYIDYNIEVSDVGEEFQRETEKRLRDLASSHAGMTGSAVALEKVADTSTYDLYRVRIAVYGKPHDITITKQDSNAMAALREALQTLEGQIRAARERRAQHNTHRDSQTHSIYYELSPEEIFAAYARDWKPEDILDMSHTEIAARLMVERNLPQDAADFAADQILLVAGQRSDPE